MRMVWLVLLGLLLATEVQAATYFVAKTGNNSNTCAQAQSTSTPKLTIQAGVNCATAAGDIVQVRTGSYVESVTLASSGTNANPKTLMAFPGEIPIMQGTGTGCTEGGIVVNAANWTIDGFDITNYNGCGLTSGAINLHDGANVGATLRIRNNHIHNFNTADNPTAIMVQQYGGTIEISNNVMHDNAGSGFTGNNTCLCIFMNGTGSRVYNIQVHHNECYNEGVGLKLKHLPDQNGVSTFHVYNNLVHDIYQRAGIECDGRDGCVFHNNIVYGMNDSIGITQTAFRIGADTSAQTGVQIYNNTVYNVPTALFVTSGTSGHTLRDNIFHTNATESNLNASIYVEGTLPSTTVNFNTHTGIATSCVDRWGGGPCETLAQFRARGFEANGVNINPLFVNPTGSSPDFHLQVSSPVNGIGTSGNDMGAYAVGNEVIGPTSGGGGGGDVIPPLPPTNLRVN